PERSFFASSFCSPYYELVMTEAVVRGRLNAPGFLEDPGMRRAYLRASYIGPSMGQINPVDEIVAAKQRVELGVSTLARESSEINGSDWEANHAQRVKEVAMRRADGLEPTIAPPPAPVGTITTPNRDALDKAEQAAAVSSAPPGKRS